MDGIEWTPIILALVAGLIPSGGLLAWLTRNKRLEAAKADKAEDEVAMAKFSSIVGSSSELQLISEKIAKNAYEQIEIIEAQSNRRIDLLQSQVDKLSIRLSEYETEITELREINKTIQDDNETYLRRIDDLTVQHAKWQLVLQINYYTMILNDVEPTINPNKVDNITMDELVKVVSSLKKSVEGI